MCRSRSSKTRTKPRRIDYLQENQEAMSRQIADLKKEVAANNAKI
jgi:hypothetical protein